MALSRRIFLLQSTALAVSLPFSASPAFAEDLGDTDEVLVGFIGPNTVQLTLTDTQLIAPETVQVRSQDRVSWSPDPTDSFGSSGKLNGRQGNFSGNENLNAPQLFTSWAEVKKGTRRGGFRVGKQPHQKYALADQPDQWDILVDGQAVGVVALYRKSSPVLTMTVASRRWESTKRHCVTLELDREIPDGAVVRVAGPSVAAFEHRKAENIFSEAIHVCHAGYPLIGPKKAYVGSWWGHDHLGQAGSTDAILSPETQWRLVSAKDDAIVRTGRLALAKPSAEPHLKDVNFNGCDIYEADFSDLDLAGDYHLQVEGLGVSFPFEVSLSPYDHVLRLAARWYFHQRSGCEIAEPYGEGITRPRNGHPDDGLTVWQTDIKLGETREGYGKGSVFKMLEEYASQVEAVGPPMTANPDAWGGWHDAGDWDRRIQHMDAVYCMADIVETFEHCRALNLNLPESGKPFAHPDVKARKNDGDLGDGETVLPDLIHEALWGASVWRRTQHADGGIIGGVEYSNSGILGSVSWNPVQTTYAYAPEDWAAYRFACGAAKLGHVIKHVCGDTVLGDAIIAEAVSAWSWADQQYIPLAEGTEENPTPSVDHILEARVTSAAAVYRASGHEAARAAFEDYNPFEPKAENIAVMVRKGVLPNVYLEYVRAEEEGRPVDIKVVRAIQGWVKYRALEVQRMGQDFGLHNTNNYVWGRGWMRFGPGSNWRAGRLAMHYASTGEMKPAMLNMGIEGMWFGLGCNPSNVSFVQGIGPRDFADPLMTDRRGTATIPGQISFGVAGGMMEEWALRKIGSAIYPADQAQWPIYNQIFESRSVVVTAEHGMKSNAMEWLVACAFSTFR